MPQPITRLALFGDEISIRQLTPFCQGCEVVAIIGAAIRPQFFDAMQSLADELGVPFFIHPKQQDTAGQKTFLTQLRALQIDGIISNNYSMRLTPALLSLAPQAAFNIHYASLPRHQGANPIEWAIIHGDDRMGITLHLMDEQYDTGPLIAHVEVPIEGEDTWFSLSKRAFVASFDLIRAVVPKLIAGQWQAVPQDPSQACYNRRIPPEGLPLDLATMEDEQLYNRIRALVAPSKGVYVDTPSGRDYITEFVPRADIPALRARYQR